MLKSGEITKNDFEEFYKNPNPWHFDSSLSDLVRQEILKKVFSSDNFLDGIDVACGEGYLTSRLDFVKNKIGLDISERAIKRASAKYKNVKFLVGDAFNENILNKNFDFVSCFEALYYPTSTQQRLCALKNIRRLGKSNATFVFSVVTIGENEYRKYYTVEEFRNLLRQADYQVVSILPFTASHGGGLLTGF